MHRGDPGVLCVTLGLEAALGVLAAPSVGADHVQVVGVRRATSFHVRLAIAAPLGSVGVTHRGPPSTRSLGSPRPWPGSATDEAAKRNRSEPPPTPQTAPTASSRPLSSRPRRATSTHPAPR